MKKKIEIVSESFGVLFLCSFILVAYCFYHPAVAKNNNKVIGAGFYQPLPLPLPVKSGKNFSHEQNCLREDYSLFGLV